MTIVRVGATKRYSEGWDKAFGGKKPKQKSASKKSATKKKAAKKKAAKR